MWYALKKQGVGQRIWECMQLHFFDKLDLIWKLFLKWHLFAQSNNGNTGTMSQNCSKLTIKTSERRHWNRSCAFIVNFEISHIVPVFPLVDFEQVNVGWVITWPIRARCCFSIPPENIRKPKSLLMFTGGIEKQHYVVMG